MAKSRSNQEAAKKRSIARRFNDSLIGRSPRSRRDKALDRRTARRLERYRNELKKGRKSGDKVLTPLDVAIRVNELLRYGDRVSEIRKLVKPRHVEYDTGQLVKVLREMHPIYQFRPEAYRFAGVRNEELVSAQVLETMPARRGPAPRSKHETPRRSTRPRSSRR